jgi:hypothetical protein
MNRRRVALRVLLLGLSGVLAAGFYLASTHQEARPDDRSPTRASPQP